MVANLGIEGEDAAKRPKTAAGAAAGPPAGAVHVRGPRAAVPPVRRGGTGPAGEGGERPSTDPDKPKKPRNRRHGRPR